MKRDFALERVFFIIIFMVNFNIIICYNLYGIHVEKQLSFQQMKNACDCVLYNYPEKTQLWNLIWRKGSIDQRSIVIIRLNIKCICSEQLDKLKPKIREVVQNTFRFWTHQLIFGFGAQCHFLNL